MVFTAIWRSGSATDSDVVGEWNEQVELFINWLPQNHAILPSESRISGFNGAKTKLKNKSLRIDVSCNTKFHAHNTAARSGEPPK